jgi:hypothetical protein
MADTSLCEKQGIGPILASEALICRSYHSGDSNFVNINPANNTSNSIPRQFTDDIRIQCPGKIPTPRGQKIVQDCFNALLQAGLGKLLPSNGVAATGFRVSDFR